jgi:hypothetical protein
VTKAQQILVKTHRLMRKRARSELRHADAIAQCEAEGIPLSSPEARGRIAFEATSLQRDSTRGRIAQAVLIKGKAAMYSFAAVARAANLSVADLSRAHLAYIENNISFRRDLVGFTLEYSFQDKQIIVREA